MQRKSCSAGLIITALCAMVSCDLIKQFYHVNEQMTWEEAQQYCRVKYIDLAFIGSQAELEQIKQKITSQRVWIGLYVDEANQQSWSGEWDSTITGQGVPSNGHKNCVSVGRNNMQPDSCNSQYNFVCFDLNVVVVRKNMTWEEALEYCRDRYTDLTSLVSETEQLQVQALMNSTGTEMGQAWMGLRFLAGVWLWVNGDPQAWTGGSLPPCPAQRRHCGTLAREGEFWGIRDCNERRYFLCSTHGKT